MDPQAMARHALHNERALQDLLNGISPRTQKSIIRENSSKAVLYLSEHHPEILLPHWADFVKLLKSDNGFSKYVAIHVIANLVTAGDEGRFDRAFNTFYKLLDDKSVMVASHVAGVSGQIARARPPLQTRITQQLLKIGHTHFPADRQALIMSYAIQSFGEYFAEASPRDQDRMVAFVQQQIDCTSPKTRKLAKDFLKQSTDSPAAPPR